MPIKVKYVLTHPIQYFVPLVQRLAQREEIALHVVFGTDAGARRYFDGEFGQEIAWDRPLLDGYNYSVLKPGAPLLPRRFGTVRADGLAPFLTRENTDVVIVHGYANHLSLGAILLARGRGLPVLCRTDSHLFKPGSRTGKYLKPLILYPLLRRLDGYLVIGTMNREYYRAIGIKPERLFWTPFSVDTSLFHDRRGSDAERRQEEARLGLRPGSFRVVFCGKLVALKRPEDVIAAVALMPSREQVEVLFIGDGHLRPSLERRARERGVRAHFLGFRNQQELPLMYGLGDVLILPSDHESWGLVVNEAMTVGLPAVVSAVVGCAPDLVREGESGYICPVGDVTAYARALEEMARSPQLRARLQQGARERIKEFHIDRTVEGYVHALDTVTARAKGRAPSAATREPLPP